MSPTVVFHTACKLNVKNKYHNVSLFNKDCTGGLLSSETTFFSAIIGREIVVEHWWLRGTACMYGFSHFLVCIKATNELQPPHPLPKPSHLTQFMTCFCSLLCSGKDNNIPKQTTHSSVYITLDANTQVDSIIVRFLLIIQKILDFWDHPKIMLCSDDSLKTVSSFKSYRNIRRVEHGRIC